MKVQSIIIHVIYLYMLIMYNCHEIQNNFILFKKWMWCPRNVYRVDRFVETVMLLDVKMKSVTISTEKYCRQLMCYTQYPTESPILYNT